MKGLCIFCCLLWHVPKAPAQKLPIDSVAYRQWSSPGSIVISPDGKYVAYTIENQPVGTRTLRLQSTVATWKIDIVGGSDVFTTRITADSRHAIFQLPGDSLGMVRLGTDSIFYLSDVHSFKIPEGANAGWLACFSANDLLMLYNFSTGQRHSLTGVKDAWFGTAGNVLFVHMRREHAAQHVAETIERIELDKHKKLVIWKGYKANHIVLAPHRQQLAFIALNNPRQRPASPSLWYFKHGMLQAEQLLDSITGSQERYYRITIDEFSEDGNAIFLTLHKTVHGEQQEKGKVQIWSYLDVKLHAQSVKESPPGQQHLALVTLTTKKPALVKLTGDFEYCVSKRKNFVCVASDLRHVGLGEAHWNRAGHNTPFVVSLHDGKRQPLPCLGDISPGGRYMVYFDSASKNYYSYETSTGLTRNITSGIATDWTNYYTYDFFGMERGVAAWLKNDEAVLLYDRFDIWQVDPAGRRPPLNMTNQYGKTNNIIFSLSEGLYQGKSISENETVIVTAFDLDNKSNGFFSKAISEHGDPEMLTMGPYLYEATNNRYVPGGSNFSPIKARDTAIYIVRRMSHDEGPNYYVTHDFRKLKPLSDINPHTKYTWFSATLHTWKENNGRTMQGILYAPESLDTTKKYPVILNYYERRTDGLHAYLKPDYLTGGGNINIPTFVSRGYLVFCPDIFYEIGDPGPSALRSVSAAANYLSTLSFVDATKLGLQGFSFGGYETNYVVTHTDRFAAAASAGSVCDFVSLYGDLHARGESIQGTLEQGQLRMDQTLWEIPGAYIRNSPLFAAPQMQTPLLLMHATQDRAAPFAQAVAFFTALRRLGKRAWLLEYKDGSHGVHGHSAADYDHRLQEFFDHYLKGKPAPVWMTHDSSLSTPPQGGILTKEARDKFERISSKSAPDILAE